MSYQKSSKNKGGGGGGDFVWFSYRTRDRCRAAHHSTRARVVLVPPLFLPAHPQSTRVRQQTSQGGINSNRRRASGRTLVRRTRRRGRACSAGAAASPETTSAPVAQMPRRRARLRRSAGASAAARHVPVPAAHVSCSCCRRSSAGHLKPRWMDCRRRRRARPTPVRYYEVGISFVVASPIVDCSLCRHSTSTTSFLWWLWRCVVERRVEWTRPGTKSSSRG